MFKSKIAFAVVAAAATVLTLTACNPATPTEPVAISSMYTPAPVETTVETPMLPAKAVDPYSSDGDWLVPSEIVPGQYKATSTGSIEGYVAVCRDLDCAIGAGMIKNYLVDGPAYITVPANAVKIHLERVTLTPMG